MEFSWEGFFHIIATVLLFVAAILWARASDSKVIVIGEENPKPGLSEAVKEKDIVYHTPTDAKYYHKSEIRMGMHNGKGHYLALMATATKQGILNYRAAITTAAALVSQTISEIIKMLG